MPTAPDTALRIALIARLKADAGVVAAVGEAVRVFDFVPEDEPFPYFTIRSQARPWDTTSDRGHEHEVLLNYWYEGEGKRHGEAVLYAVQRAFRDHQAALSDHALRNLEWRFEDVVRDEARRHLAHQRWRAVTEETA
ncbi:MAG: DUF3168 domain-containing protein [Alphaproteobacteria bacterium]|nr:DUF3168 domain-containing protein [Alphaproteobacteria bacterium]